jgi:guanylate kinase
MSEGLLVLVSAPSGAGKTSLVAAMLARDDNLVVSVSHTTRAMRNGETDGVNYHFVTPAQFTSMVNAREFLEHATVFGNQYGTAKSEVAAKRQAGHDVILEIDWQGAEQVRALIPDAVSVFILPPSKDTLRERLNDRGQDSADTIAKRLAEAELEMAQAHSYQYVVVNDDFDTALVDLQAIIRAERLKTKLQMSANPAVRSLL